jgi:hypothetical protein
LILQESYQASLPNNQSRGEVSALMQYARGETEGKGKVAGGRAQGFLFTFFIFGFTWLRTQ